MTSDPPILKPCVIRVQSCCIDLSRNGLMTGENGVDGQNAQKKLLQFVESSLELIMEPQIGIVESNYMETNVIHYMTFQCMFI